MFRRVYLDNAATTQPDPKVVAAMMPYLTEKFGNASSIHHFGQEARSAVDKARHQIAELVRARQNEIIFTSGGTESNNLAIRGSLGTLRTFEGKKPHVITSAIEHPAVTNVCEMLEKTGAADVTYLPVYADGIVRVADVADAVRDETVLISIMAANNEIGTLQPINEIGHLCSELRAGGHKLKFHSDAVQWAGKLRLDVNEIGCDLLSISAHKIHALKGSGALYVKRGTRLASQNLGGHQEREEARRDGVCRSYCRVRRSGRDRFTRSGRERNPRQSSPRPI